MKSQNSELTIETLAIRLELLGIPPHCYSLCGFKDDALCLETTEDGWIVYVAERGRKNYVERFDSETAACTFILDELRVCILY